MADSEWIQESLSDPTVLLNVIMNNMRDLVAIADLEGNLVFASPSHELLGYSASLLIGRNVMSFVHPDDLTYVADEFKKFMERGRIDRAVEYRCRCADGSYVWLETLATLLDDTSRTPNHVFFNSRDITERKRAEEEIKRQLSEKEILLREVHHRIKNNIAFVESLLSLQIGTATSIDVIAALQDAQSRVASMRLLYDKLLIDDDYRDASAGNYAESLIDAICAVYPEREKVTVEKYIADFPMNPRKMVLLGIIINELLTNTLKYAFKGHDGGRITITLERKPDGGVLEIRDNGSGFVDNPRRRDKSSGLGLTIVGMLAEQLRGSFSMEDDHGIHSTVEFELS